MKKFPLPAKRFDNFALITIVRDVAACAARHQNLDAQLFVLFKQQDLATRFGRTCRGHQPCGPGSDDDDVKCFQIIRAC